MLLISVVDLLLHRCFYRFYFWVIVFLFLICGFQNLKAQEEYDFYDQKTPFPITLELDIKALIKSKYKETPQKAILSYHDRDSVFHAYPIEVNARGNFRKNHCYFPPIELKLKGVELEDSTFTKYTKLKLVTHCKYAPVYEQYVIQEYLVYQLYNLFSPYSFRARLLRITYIDSRGKQKPREEYGFVIEQTRLMARRLNCREIETEGVSQQELLPEDICRLAIFQYMIGNHDWKVPALHNIKLLMVNDFAATRAIPVPYDFDYSGIVNTHYAVPHPNYGLETVRDRVYQGECQPREVVEPILEEFRQKKEAVYELYRQQSLLDNFKIQETIEYLDEFYRIIGNHQDCEQVFMQGCVRR